MHSPELPPERKRLSIEEPRDVVSVRSGMPRKLPSETTRRAVKLPIVVFDITPEPALLSSGAVKEPPSVPMLTTEVVP